LIVIASLLDELAVILIIVILLSVLRVEISWEIVVTLVALFVGMVLFMHKLLIPVLHRQQLTGWENLIGARARVVETLKPQGLIIVQGEYWKAKSEEGIIKKGEQVEVQALHGLVLTVKRVKP